MINNSPDIKIFKTNLESCIDSARKNKLESFSAIKIQHMLNITIYVMATRFLEASVKHIVYNCCIMRGDDHIKLKEIEIQLKKFNNPEFKYIKEILKRILDFDITMGIRDAHFNQRDIDYLDQIVQNRHRNVHASYDSTEWYNQNKKDLSDFEKEYEGMVKIVAFLDKILYEKSTGQFKIC
ncbi:MAG: hypothetical protein N2645_17020 [Clostridia bacterium]|nr:hypothetical protein [Clostridia bacterium]